MMGIPVDEPAFVFGDNQSVLCKTTVPGSTLRKKQYVLAYTIDRVSSHSLRAGGAMALKLAGATTDTIMRRGRWTSNMYMTYIHAQIGALTKGIAWRMSRNHMFHNVG